MHHLSYIISPINAVNAIVTPLYRRNNEMELQAIGSGMGRRRIPPVPRTAGVSWICKHLSTL